MNGDPTTDVTATRKITAVWKEGHRVDRETYAAAAAADRARAEQARNAPAPEYGESGLISDFEGDKITAAFGAGWIVSTDTMYQGKSQAAMKLVPDGAEGSRGALEITGEILPGAPFKWAGAMFSPGNSIMAPVNLSSKKAVVFWAKGDGPSLRRRDLRPEPRFHPGDREFHARAGVEGIHVPLLGFQAGRERPHGDLHRGRHGGRSSSS